jgi:hypothetical protein
MRHRILLRLCLIYPQNVFCLSPRLTQPPFSRRWLQHPCLLSLTHNTTPSAPTRLTPNAAPSHHLYKLPEISPVRRAASQVLHTIVSLLDSRAPSRLPILRPVHASHLPWLRRVRRRRRTTQFLHRLPALSRHFTFPSHFVVQSQTATSHTDKRTDSSTT